MISKLFCVIFSLFVFISCNDSKTESTNTQTADTTNPKAAWLPVTEFFRGQLAQLKTVEVSPLRTITKNGKTDSIWIKREEISGFASAFLDPVIDSAHQAEYFSEKSFLDQTVDAFTFTYEPKSQLPKDSKLQKWDVYVDPNTQEIKRVYMVKESSKDGIKTTEQLTWKSAYFFKITRITEAANSTPVIEEEQVIWNFD